jgi:hypothetical protein
MRSEVQEFKQLCITLSQHRRMCTGEALDTSFIESWPGHVRSSADFGMLVSAAYKLWRENWKLDIGFLLGPRSAGGPGWHFDQLIYQLRTAIQHADNQRAKTQWDDWTRDACEGHPPATESDWGACGRALMVVLNAALALLCRTAAAGKRQETFRRAWLAKVGESVAAIVNSVAEDLGMYLNQGTRGYHVRDVERRWRGYRLRGGEAPAEALASLAEQSLISQIERLPCNYLRILDELRVLGTANAIAALHLAHAVAEISRTSGETYMKLVKSTWITLQPDAIP